MFCTQCGSHAPETAKFCNSCGLNLQPFVAALKEAPKSSDIPRSLGRVFLDTSGVVVTEAVFKASAGSSYPIRNITSVSVRRRTPNVLISIVAVGLTFFGLLILMLGSVLIGLLACGIGGMFWWNIATQPFELRVGSGGVEQVAIESKEEEHLQRIALSINEAVLEMQRPS